MADEIWARNLEALRARYPALADEMERYAPTGQCAAEDAKNGQITLKAKIGEQWRYLHSKFDPGAEAEKWADGFTLRRRNCIALFGLGLGYQVEALAARLKEHDDVLVCEPCPDIFCAALRARDLRPLLLNPHVLMCVGQIDAALVQTMTGAFHGRAATSLTPLALPYYGALDPDAHRAFSKVVQDYAVSRNTDINTLASLVEKWTEQALDNLAYLTDAINVASFADRFAGVPMILVSAGPSLNKNVEQLKRAQGRFPIVCVYTAYRVLAAHGIRPDLVVAIDASQTKYETDEQVQLAADVPLLCDLMTDKRLMRVNTGRKVIVSGGGLLDAIYKRYGKPQLSLPSGGSVATLAASFSITIGAYPMIMVGQDLAFTGDKTHADGTFYDGRNAAGAEGELTVAANDGGALKTSKAMYTYKVWFDIFCTVRAKGGYTVINATEGGAKIDGADVMPLAEAIDRYWDKGVDVAAVLNDIYENNTLLTREEAADLAANLREECGKIAPNIAIMEEIIRLLKRVSKVYEKGQAHRQKDVNAWLARIGEIDQEIMKSPLLLSVTAAFVERSEMDRVRLDLDGQLDDDAFILARQRALYEGYLRALTFVKPHFEKAAREFADAAGVSFDE